MRLAGLVQQGGKGGSAAGRLCEDMQIRSSGPQSKAFSFVVSQRCLLASKMEMHRYVPDVTESVKLFVLLCVVVNLSLLPLIVHV